MLNLFVAEYPNSVSGRLNLGAAHLARVRKNSGTPQGLSEVMPILPDPGIVVRSAVDVLDLYHARENFEGALRVRPGEVLAQAGLGLVHTRLGEYDQARSRLDQARSAAPTRPELSLCRGNVEYLAEDYPRAASFYREALSLHPDWPEATKNLAMTYEKQDEPAQAGHRAFHRPLPEGGHRLSGRGGGGRRPRPHGAARRARQAPGLDPGVALRKRSPR